MADDLFDTGGTLPTGLSLVTNATDTPEPLLPPATHEEC